MNTEEQFSKENILDLENIFGPKEDKQSNNTILESKRKPDLLDALADRTSGAYLEAATKNGHIKEDREYHIEDPLTSALSVATHITEDVKKRYLYLAEVYMSSMQDNIFLTQFDLHTKYSDITIDEWNDFLNDRIVSVYINKHKKTILRNAANANLADPTAKNKRDNLKLIENLQEQDKLDAQKNVVIIRIPDIYDSPEE